MKFKETNDIFRLYRREWITVHTVTLTGCEDARPCVEMAMAWTVDNLKGRVRNEDINLVANTDHAGTFWVWVQVFKENLKGEFKWAANAEVYARDHDYEEFTVVARNSKDDHAIRSYGVRKL